MTHFNFGYTTNKLPIAGYKFGHTGKKILILAGVHGDEIEGVQAGLKLHQVLAENYDFKLQITLVPQFNLDGILAGTRKNARGVDLNRNLPSKDWSPEIAKEKYHPGPSANSEPENQALVNYINAEKPELILTLHSWKPLLNSNGKCENFAKVISKYTDYVVTPDIGYPTPGSLGNYGSNDQGIPVLTYEFDRPMDPIKIVDQHVPAIIEGLKWLEDNPA